MKRNDLRALPSRNPLALWVLIAPLLLWGLAPTLYGIQPLPEASFSGESACIQVTGQGETHTVRVLEVAQPGCEVTASLGALQEGQFALCCQVSGIDPSELAPATLIATLEVTNGSSGHVQVFRALSSGGGVIIAIDEF